MDHNKDHSHDWVVNSRSGFVIAHRLDGDQVEVVENNDSSRCRGRNTSAVLSMEERREGFASSQTSILQDGTLQFQ